MKLGELIIAYRKEHKLSQRQFAKKCGGVSNGYVSMLENDFNPATSKGITPSLDKLVCIASGMDMSVSELMEKVEDMPMDLSEVVARDVIYEDESDREFCDMIMHARPKEGILVKEPELPNPSAEALEIARRYDTLDMHGREIIRAVLRIEDKRCESKRFADAYLSELPTNEYGQPVGIAYQDGTVEAKYAAKKEMQEMQEEKVDV